MEQFFETMIKQLKHFPVECMRASESSIKYQHLKTKTFFYRDAFLLCLHLLAPAYALESGLMDVKWDDP